MCACVCVCEIGWGWGWDGVCVRACVREREEKRVWLLCGKELNNYVTGSHEMSLNLKLGN